MNESNGEPTSVEHDPRTGWKPVPANLFNKPRFVQGYIDHLHSRAKYSLQSLKSPDILDLYCLGWFWALSFETAHAGQKRNLVDWLDPAEVRRLSM